MTTVTIPKELGRKGALVIIDKETFENLSRENGELRLALKAVVAGEQALAKGRTRSLKDFLKSEFPHYVRNQ